MATTNNNINDYIDNTDMMNEDIQAQATENVKESTEAPVGAGTDDTESNPVEDAPTEQKNGQVDNNDSAEVDYVPTVAKLKEVTGKKREELTKEQEKDMKELIYEFRDTITAIFGILMLPNGKLVDFSDREGRKQLKDSLIVFKGRMEKAFSDASLANKDYAEQIAKAIPKKIQGELVNEDRDRIDGMRRYWKACIAIMFGTILISSASFFFSGKKYSKANTRSEELEQWYADNNDAVNFGKYLKEKAPDTYEYWHSGQWEKDEKLIDSLSQSNKFHEWKK